MSTKEAFHIVTPQRVESMFNCNVLGMFSYGSAVYQNKEPSDLDYIVFTDMNESIEQSSFDVFNTSIQITFYSIKDVKRLLSEEEISILECLYLFKNKDSKDSNEINMIYSSEIVEKLFQSHYVNLSNLRSSVSKKSSNSYVKAKKKLLIENDFDIETSYKSLWHSLRIIDFGNQIASLKNIEDFESSNDLFYEIKDDYSKFNQFKNVNDFWNFLHLKYKPLHNFKMQEFRINAPK